MTAQELPHRFESDPRKLSVGPFEPLDPLGLAGRTKHLEPMGPGDLVCFCNYFRMPATDSYEIRVSIRRAGVPEVTRAKFLYRPAPGS